jgi:tetratricopeptide (TPR) repeat protein
MVGIVLKDVANVGCELQIQSLLFVGHFSNIRYPNLSQPSNWSLTNLPILSPIFLLILASIIFILFYLYKTSELMNKKKLISILAVTIFLFLLISFLSIQQNRSLKVKFRLTLIAFQSDSTTSHSSWIGDALWNMTVRQVQHSVAGQAIISPVDWTQAIIKADSIHELVYLKNLNKRLKAEYLLIGKISAEKKSPNIIYQMVNIDNGEIIINRSLSLIPQNLPEISNRICDEILNYFNIEPKISETSIRYTSPDAYQKYLSGKEFYQEKNYQFAIDLSQQSIAADSSIVEAYVLAGKSYFMRGVEKKKKGESPLEEFEHAKELLNQAVALDSSFDEAYDFLGEYYIYRERWSLAEQMLLKAYRLNPNQPRLYLSLSRLHQSRYQKLGLKNEEQLYRRAIFINPCYEDGYLMLADYYLFNNQRDKAIQVLEQFLDINPNSVPALMALGKIYLVRNEILKIIKIYDRVLELEPSSSDAYYNLGILYYNSKDFENAEKFLKRAIAIDNHLNAHLYLAYLYEIKGEYDKAIEHLRQRIRYRKGLDDEFAEEARKHLFELLHPKK